MATGMGEKSKLKKLSTECRRAKSSNQSFVCSGSTKIAFFGIFNSTEREIEPVFSAEG
jgi:hypothetical protein